MFVAWAEIHAGSIGCLTLTDSAAHISYTDSAYQVESDFAFLACCSDFRTTQTSFGARLANLLEVWTVASLAVLPTDTVIEDSIDTNTVAVLVFQVTLTSVNAIIDDRIQC